MKFGKLFIVAFILCTTFATLSTLANSEIEIVSSDSEFKPEPMANFKQRVNLKLNGIHQMVERRRLRDALAITRQLEHEIAFEIRKGGTEYGECFYDSACKERVSQSTPTKEMCEASGGGSWKKTNPSSGPCVAI